MAFAAALQERASEPVPGVTVTVSTWPGGTACALRATVAEGVPSAAWARVAITRTVYSVPGVRPVMV